MRWTETSNGYIAGYAQRKKVYEHRWVWEQAHGPIPPGYYIHHRDGNRRNNAIENLELMAPKPHCQHHWEVAVKKSVYCADCGREVVRIKPDLREPVCRACQSKRAEAKRKEWRVCQVCGTKFFSRRLANAKGDFCSQRCVNLGGRWKS